MELTLPGLVARQRREAQQAAEDAAEEEERAAKNAVPRAGKRLRWSGVVGVEGVFGRCS